ncbi:hypothetical protein X474_07590 [Dethiosulfatarculus sandiegensis]|uniref:Uncharacterized protein n=1 Tax=Dethiosulfatarculus sandiegensis TaxID=1429043 RepID=A0A0D2J8W2_9BACT|nr:hypothetical protein X474_07590 [Dethiosulfatarculus sandiegensis]
MTRTMMQMVMVVRMVFSNMSADEFRFWHRIFPLLGKKGGITGKRKSYGYI